MNLYKAAKKILIYLSMLGLILGLAVLWKVITLLEVSPALKSPRVWIEGPFRKKNPDKPRIGYMIAKTWLGDFEQAQRWRLAMEKKGIDLYFFDLWPGDEKNLLNALAHRVVIFFLNPDFVFTPARIERPPSQYAYAATWTAYNMKEPIWSDYDGYLNTNPDHDWFERGVALHQPGRPITNMFSQVLTASSTPWQILRGFFTAEVYGTKRGAYSLRHF